MADPHIQLLSPDLHAFFPFFAVAVNLFFCLYAATISCFPVNASGIRLW